MADAAPIDRLLDILELVERIERQTGKLTRETFLQGAGVRPFLRAGCWFVRVVLRRPPMDRQRCSRRGRCRRPIVAPKVLTIYSDGLRKAGLPEE
jgi:hypothetical protein